MIEIVCPSCGARYQVPDDSIGPEGRKVTCSGCSHKWRAYREAPAASAAEAAEPAATEAAAASGTDRHDTGGQSAADFGEEAAPTPAGSGSREQQMDAIRRMLDDLKRSSEDEPGPAPEVESTASPPRPERPKPTSHRREEYGLEDEPGGDPLKSRIEQLSKDGKEARPSNYDAAKLRKLHEKRARRLQRAKERKRRSGGFLTGFTLVAVVTATMVGLYVLQPQIIASSPQMEPAMNQYVVTVDRYRVALDEATADWRAWVAERVGPLLGAEEQAADAAGDGAAGDGAAQQPDEQGESTTQ